MALSTYEREVRLGIVMYGGVSLAVYENGVAQELFRAVKGEGVYTLIKSLTESDIVVDIMSGTSAGGINGIFLGYALANDRDFKFCADLWRYNGDFLKLLRQPNDTNTNSILNSQGYYQPALASAFANMPSYKPTAGIVSDIEELDMFVTGTSAYGHIFTEFDSQGHPIDVKDHRQLFQLSFRRDRKNDFEPGGAAALAKLSRTTSCFPVAFEPVHVDPGDADDARILQWGKLAEEVYFLDGGLLNNKPFTLSLGAIFHRTEDREVERMLLYVEPDPERFAKRKSLLMPDVTQAAFDALVSIPGYQSIATDLQEIAEHNDRVRRYKEIYECVQDFVPQTVAAVEIEPADFQALDTDLQRKTLYLRCRLNQIRDRTLDGILKERGQKLLLQDGERRAAEILVQSFGQWEGGGTDTLTDFDIYYRLRRLYRLTYALDTLLYEKGRNDLQRNRLLPNQVAGYRDLWRRLNHQIKVLEIIQEAMETLIDLAPIPWKDLEDQRPGKDPAIDKWARTQNLMRALLSLDGSDLEDPNGLSIDRASRSTEADANERKKNDRLQRLAFRIAMNERVRRMSGSTGIPAEGYSGNLLHETDRLEREILSNFAPFKILDPISREYCRFLILDSYLFPLQYMSGMESTDVIRTVRISPIDAQLGYSRRSLAEKLSGKQLGHFGGFLKASWRANDIMWGRLDAVCQLVQCLVTPERIKNVSAQTLAEVVQGTNFDQLFPNSSIDERQQIKTAIANLKSDAASDPLSRQAFNDIWTLLTFAAQREILGEELKNVLDAAVRQQGDWNQYVIRKPKSKLPFTSEKYAWTTGVRQVDSEIMRYATTKLSEEPAPDGGWHQYFSKNYGVGDETWQNDIPKPILLEIIATMAVVLRNCLLGAAGSHAQQIRSSWIYKLGLNWPLMATYYFAHWERTAPEFYRLLFAAIFAACVSTLTVEAIWWKSLFSPNGAIHVGALARWVAPPLLILFALLIFLRWRYKRSSKLTSIRETSAMPQS
jgi:patatin-related protein